MANEDFLAGLSLPNVSSDPSYANIIKMLQSQGSLPTMTGSFVPQAQQLLLGRDSDAMKGLQQTTAQNVAAAQSNAMKRGLTGSSVEAFGMNQAQQSGQLAEAQYRAQTASDFMSILQSAMQGDLQSAQQLRQMIAQAMGQKMTSDQEYSMFQQQLNSANEQAKRNSQNALWGAGIGAVGSLGGGAIGLLK
ncbi:MAG: hypothetical protein WC713_00875 [Candidatus Methylomirabilota bacterium]|jgi:hypothetical protein